MIAPMTYRVLLEQVDHSTAAFAHVNPSDPDASRLAVSMPRQDWLDLGRPSRLMVTLVEDCQ